MSMSVHVKLLILIVSAKMTGLNKAHKSWVIRRQCKYIGVFAIGICDVSQLAVSLPYNIYDESTKYSLDTSPLRS